MYLDEYKRWFSANLIDFDLHAELTSIENEVLDKLQYAPVETITVQPGDSLWKIAEDHNVSGVSTTDMVHYVQKINHISSDSLVSGQLLKIPVA